MKILDLGKLERAVFLERLNRFLCLVDFNGKVLEAHVHDPGRLSKLLYRGNEVWIKYVGGSHRRTAYDVVVAKGEDGYVLVHSGYHRMIAKAVMESGRLPVDLEGNIRMEVTYGDSRLDFLIERDSGRNVWIEVKGCTLIENGIAFFPDAPTRRGLKHLKELVKIVDEGETGVLLILIFSKAKCFSPNVSIDPEFASFFWKAIDHGVKVIPVVLHVEGNQVYLGESIPICENPSFGNI